MHDTCTCTSDKSCAISWDLVWTLSDKGARLQSNTTLALDVKQNPDREAAKYTPEQTSYLRLQPGTSAMRPFKRVINIGGP